MNLKVGSDLYTIYEYALSLYHYIQLNLCKITASFIE